MPRVADVERAHTLALNLDAQRTVRASLADLDVQRSALYGAQLRLLAELARLQVERPARALLEVAGTLGVGQGQATVELLLHLTAGACALGAPTAAILFALSR